MSCDLTPDSFHGTKKGQTAITRRKAYQGKAYLIKRNDVKSFIETLRSANQSLLLDDRTTLNIRALISIYDRYGKGKDLTLSFR